MSAAQEAVASALEDLQKSRRMLGRVKGSQVRNLEHRQFLQAIAFTWFRSRKPLIATEADRAMVDEIDGYYKSILTSTERAAGWSYDPNSNSLVFDARGVPAEGETIRVEYRAACF